MESSVPRMGGDRFERVKDPYIFPQRKIKYIRTCESLDKITDAPISSNSRSKTPKNEVRYSSASIIGNSLNNLTRTAAISTVSRATNVS